MNPSLSQMSPAGANGKSPDRTGTPPPNPADAPRQSFHEWLCRLLVPPLAAPLRVVLWNGTEFATGPGRPVARLRLRDRRTLWQILRNTDLGFGDAYSDGRIEVEGDFVTFLERMFQSPPPSATARFVQGCLSGRWLPRPWANSLKRSRDNIYHHYDVGNDFYRLWLDEQLVYTCAYFPTPDTTLEEAQIAKMDHVCRKLRLRPGETVVEAGCGWGTLARHMARHYGVTVTACNISREQIAYARARARAEGLDGRVTYVQDDYRNLSGSYDAFVSVGMLEHVGVRHYRELGGVIRRCLRPSGRGLIHSIGRNRPWPTNPWLEKRIFPGAYMPSLGEMMRIFEPYQFSVLDVENLRLHYAKTLGHWLRRFEHVADEVEKMFDPRFVRAWRLYLASSMVGFSTGHFQLFQVLFAPATNNAIPMTRDDIYGRTAAATGAPHAFGQKDGQPWKLRTS